MKNIVFLLLGIFEIGQCANILGIFNHPGASHTVLGKVLLKKLAEKGHKVSMISAFPMEKPIPNYRDIYLGGFLEDLKRRQNMYFESKLSNHQQTKNMSLQHTMDTFKNPEVQKLLKSNEVFDVIVMDYFFNEATLIFGHVLKAPVILMSSFGNNFLTNPFTGNSLPISYVPGASLPVSDDMSFKHRLIMAAINVVAPIFQYYRLQEHEAMLKQYFPSAPSIDELKKNVALVLSNSHFTFETPRPYTPNIIPVGGLHVEELKPLPKDLKAFLDDAKEGVIFFSLGSQIKASSLDEGAFQSISKAFARLPQKVLWKWENDYLPKVSDNVRLEKWLPQKEILSHSNVKVFFTHGGVLSMIEAIYFGVPMLFIPFNGDQPTNAAFAKSRKFGLILDSKQITEEIVYKQLKALTEDPIYSKNAAYYSDLMRNQPMKPIDIAVYWVEHVIKHRGAPHLRPFSLSLPWYKYYMIDVISFVFVIFSLVLCVLYYLVKTMFKCFVRRKFSKVHKMKKNK